MNQLFQSYIQFDGFAFLIIGIIVLISPSPQPGLSRPVPEAELLPFSQTRRLLAAMFIATALLLMVIGSKVSDPEVLQLIALVRVVSFVLVIVLNALQYKSKRWKSAPLLVLMSLFTLMSILYMYFIFEHGFSM
jgi:hypothetical protein